MNLETGLREAKLLDKDEKSSSANDIISVPSESLSQEELSRQNLEKAFANLDLTKDDVPTDQVALKFNLSNNIHCCLFLVRYISMKYVKNIDHMMN